jgi:hypothetical protein
VFHVELRQFPNVARAFNLSGEELQRRFLAPWVTGRSIELDERRWSPEKARLKIYEGPALRPEEIGMGRGWGNVTQSGREVTDRLLEQAQQALAPSQRAESVQELKAEVMERIAGSELTVPGVLALAIERHRGWRASDRLALAELAIWELLHQQRIRIVRGQEPVAQEEWATILLAWETWAPDGVAGVLSLELAG